MNATTAAQYGIFALRGSGAGLGDGNGSIQGSCPYCAGALWGWLEGAGETVMFWVDLTSANGQNINLIEGNFATATPITPPAGNISLVGLGLYFPQAKLGNGNYVYVWTSNSNYASAFSPGIWGNPYPQNYYGISAVTAILGGGGAGRLTSTPNIPVSTAYNIDRKMDDGLPLSGNVQTVGVSDNVYWSVDNTWNGNNISWSIELNNSPPQFAVVPSAITCFDNGGNTNNPMVYSTEINGGAGGNCALSFKMQGGD
jgi:hypothetical protein